MKEFLEANLEQEQLEELVDILELIYGCIHNKGIVIEWQEEICQRKHKERGGFEKRIMLLTKMD